MQRIGFIGLGDMGIYMSRNLMNAGYSVKGFDISKERKDQFSELGGTVCATNSEVGIDIDVAIIMVVTGAQVESVMFGQDGLLETLKPGTTVIITATIGDKSMASIAKRVEEKGIEVIDCAVTGGQGGANAGTLSMMVAGKKEVFQANKEILEKMGKTIVFAGEKPGMGQIVKACNGVMSAVTAVGTCEALALGVKAGVAPEVILEVLGNGMIASPMFKYYTEKIMNRDFYNGGTQIKLLYKDTNLVLELAKECGIPMHTTAVANETVQAAISKYPDADSWIMVKLFEDITGVEVTRTEP